MLTAWIRKKLAQAVEGFIAWALANPRSVIWPLLRTLAPILKLGPLVMVSRFDDVYEVLSDDEVFHVTYAQNMEDMTDGGNFFLGMNNTPAYTRDVSNMRVAVRREDIPDRIAPFVALTASDIVTASLGELDAVAELTKIVPTRLIGDYFGTPGPSESELMDWASSVFQFLFIDPKNDPIIRTNALKAARRLRDYLDCVIRKKMQQKNTSDDDVVSRCVRMHYAGIPGMKCVDDVRNNLFGLIVGALPTTSKAAAFALDVLLDRPRELADAGKAARADDDPRLAAYVFEALRFKPINPGLFRVVARDHRLAAGSFRSKLLRKGATVLAVSQSAMFDPRRMRAPSSFRVDRPPDAHFHFGKGMHTCFGQYISQVQIPGILKPLLKCRGLRRVSGESGRLRMKGPFPAHLMVEFVREIS